MKTSKILKVFKITKTDIVNLFDFHLTGIVGFFLRSIIHGIVIKILWIWFVEGTFSFIPYHPGFLEFSGVYLIFVYAKHDYRVSWNHHQFQIESDDEETGRIRQIVILYKKMFLRSGGALVAGGLLKLLIMAF